MALTRRYSSDDYTQRSPAPPLRLVRDSTTTRGIAAAVWRAVDRVVPGKVTAVNVHTAGPGRGIVTVAVGWRAWVPILRGIIRRAAHDAALVAAAAGVTMVVRVRARIGRKEVE